MKQRLIRFALAISVLALLFTSTASQQTPPDIKDPTLLILDSAVREMTTQITEYAQSQPDKRKSQLIDLIKEQRHQLETVESKYKGQSTPPTREELSAALKDFFAAGAKIREALQPAKDSVQASQYSPDPSQCANHCYKTCGYNSLGEKVCWYTCYRCCSKGGC